eukprot:5796176-Amphidinium_carterae.1
MFRIGPVIEEDGYDSSDPGFPEERRLRDPFEDLDPHNPPHPKSVIGKAVIRWNNQLRKIYIGRRKANDGSHHDSSPSSGHSYLTSDEDFNEHPELTFNLTPEDRRIVEVAEKMRFNRDFPALGRRMVTPPPEAQSDGDHVENEQGDPGAGEEAEVVDYRTPRV